MTDLRLGDEGDEIIRLDVVARCQQSPRANDALTNRCVLGASAWEEDENLPLRVSGGNVSVLAPFHAVSAPLGVRALYLHPGLLGWLRISHCVHQSCLPLGAESVYVVENVGGE